MLSYVKIHRKFFLILFSLIILTILLIPFLFLLLDDFYAHSSTHLVVVSDYDEQINTIKPGDCIKFLRNLKTKHKKITKGSIIFHNDSDGLFSGILARNLLRNFGFEISPLDMRAITHLDLPNIKHESNKIYFYVDIQPRISASNVYCVDHHLLDGKTFEFSSNNFIYSPENIEREFPTTSALLVIYLDYIQSGGMLSFVEYINQKIWAKQEFKYLLCAWEP